MYFELICVSNYLIDNLERDNLFCLFFTFSNSFHLNLVNSYVMSLSRLSHVCGINAFTRNFLDYEYSLFH